MNWKLGIPTDFFTVTAIKTIERSFGTKYSIEFLTRAWKNRSLFELRDTSEKLYLMHRAALRGITFHESLSELQQATSGIKSDDSLLSIQDVVTKIKYKLGTDLDFSSLEHHVNSVLREAEAELTTVNSLKRYSDWISGLRNLSPKYLALHRLLLEALFSSSGKVHAEIERHDRLVDERCVDIAFIGGMCHANILMLAAIDIARAQTPAARKFAVRAHSKGRIMFPTFIAKRILQAKEWTAENSDSLSEEIIRSLRPGHKYWFADRPREQHRDASA